MNDLVNKHLLRADPVHHGLTCRGVIEGLTLTRGWAWCRPGGAFLLYRKSTTRKVDEPVGSAGPAARTIRPYSWISQEAATRYLFACRAAGPGGVEAVDPAGTPPMTVVSTKEDGSAAAPAPPSPRRQTARAVAGGRIVLEWEHVPSAAFAEANEFRIYTDEGSGNLDLEEPAAVVRVRAGGGGGLYGWRSGPFGHGLTVQFLIRAATIGGIEDGNALIVAAIADAEGPAAAVIAGCEWGNDA